MTPIFTKFWLKRFLYHFQERSYEPLSLPGQPKVVVVNSNTGNLPEGSNSEWMVSDGKHTLE